MNTVTPFPAGAARVSPRDRDAMLQSLRAGVVPRRGIHLAQVGRSREIAALNEDIDRVANGGGAFRAVCGTFGSGKSFLLYLARSIALEKGLVAVNADLTPDRRLAGESQAMSLYVELMANLSTKTKPDGGAVPSLVEKFVTGALQQAKAEGRSPSAIIHERLHELHDSATGYTLAEVVDAYWTGHETGDEQRKSDAVKWLRGGFSTRTDARKALGVRGIVEHDQVHDTLKLIARFARLAGYKGLLVCIDELVNVMKLAHGQARNANWEQMLRIVNDSLQGTACGIGFLFGATPETLHDPRRGMFSYAALETRLSENRFAAAHGLADYSGPVIRLAPLTPEELFVLLQRLRELAGGETSPLPLEAIPAFLDHCSKTIGAAYFQTPRETIRAFLQLHDVLTQHPELDWRHLVASTAIASESAAITAEANVADDVDDDLSKFRL